MAVVHLFDLDLVYRVSQRKQYKSYDKKTQELNLIIDLPCSAIPNNHVPRNELEYNVFYYEPKYAKLQYFEKLFQYKGLK